MDRSYTVIIALKNNISGVLGPCQALFVVNMVYQTTHKPYHGLFLASLINNRQLLRETTLINLNDVG